MFSSVVWLREQFLVKPTIYQYYTHPNNQNGSITEPKILYYNSYRRRILNQLGNSNIYYLDRVLVLFAFIITLSFTPFSDQLMGDSLY